MMRLLPGVVGLLLIGGPALAETARLRPAKLPDRAIPVVVEPLPSAPAVDGRGDDWPPGAALAVALQPAIEDDTKHRVGVSEVALRAGVHGDRIYFLLRWADPHPDTRYKEWRWDGSRYRRGKQLDDMLALRFDLDGDYDSCMLTDRAYRVDTWLWSAGRSNPVGAADDMVQEISTRLTENAAEYPGPSGKTVYIRKLKDAGQPLYSNTRPDTETFAGDTLPGVAANPAAGGSAADVTARGVWADGFWQLELSRALRTGHDDDVVLTPGRVRRGAVAVFDRANAEHKSVSGELQFDLGRIDRR